MSALVTTHVATGVSRLTERYRKERISALLASWLDEVQAFELVLYDLLIKRAPSTAEGAVLDLLGKVVGQERGGRSDESYRLWIAARILINHSSGTAAQLIAIARKLCNGPVSLRQYAGNFILRSESAIVGSDGVEIAKLLKLATAAGVDMHFVWFDTPSAFRFSQSGSSAFLSQSGFGFGRLAAVSDGRDMDFEAAPEEPEVEDIGNPYLLVVF